MVTRPTKTVPLLVDARDADRAAHLILAEKERRLAVERERATPAKRGAVTRKINKVRADMDVLEAGIAEGVVTVTVQALPWAAYRRLLKEHPPRPDDEYDAELGYNEETFLRGLLTAATVDAVDHAGDPYPIDYDALLDDRTGLDPHSTLAWFRAAMSLQTRPMDLSPRRRAS